MRSVRMLLILLLFCTANVFAQNQGTTVFNEDKTGVPVTSENPEFTVKLKSNPSTGYSWFLREYDPALIVPVKHHYEPPADRKLMGAPGYEIWTFKVKSEGFHVPQQTVVRLVYARPWEGVDQSKQVVFRVSTIAVPSTSRSQNAE